jgi:hypothetical protein
LSNVPFRDEVAVANVTARRIAPPLFGRASQRADQARVECRQVEECMSMNSVIYLVGLVVVVAAILSFVGIR